MQSFQRALRLKPNFLSAWTLMGHEYMELKNINAAMKSYRQAIGDFFHTRPIKLFANFISFGRGQLAGLQSLVWSGTDVRNTQNAPVQSVPLQESASPPTQRQQNVDSSGRGKWKSRQAQGCYEVLLQGPQCWWHRTDSLAEASQVTLKLFSPFPFNKL